MSKIADAEANATSLDGLVNDNGLIPTLRNGPKPSWQYLVNEVRNSRGFRVVGDFASGFTYELFNDVGIDTDGNSWIYVGAGAPNKVVPSGTVPSVVDGYEQVTFNSARNIDGLYEYFNVDNIADLLSYTGSSKKVSTSRFLPFSEFGAGVYELTIGVHDGGSFIDPSRELPANWNEQSQVDNWLLNTGQVVSGWKLLGDSVDATHYGAVSDDSSYGYLNAQAIRASLKSSLKSTIKTVIYSDDVGQLTVPFYKDFIIDGELYFMGDVVSSYFPYAIDITSLGEFNVSGSGYIDWEDYDNQVSPIRRRLFNINGGVNANVTDLNSRSCRFLVSANKIKVSDLNIIASDGTTHTTDATGFVLVGNFKDGAEVSRVTIKAKVTENGYDLVKAVGYPSSGLNMFGCHIEGLDGKKGDVDIYDGGRDGSIHDNVFVNSGVHVKSIASSPGFADCRRNNIYSNSFKSVGSGLGNFIYVRGGSISIKDNFFTSSGDSNTLKNIIHLDNEEIFEDYAVTSQGDVNISGNIVDVRSVKKKDDNTFVFLLSDTAANTILDNVNIIFDNNIVRGMLGLSRGSALLGAACTNCILDFDGKTGYSTGNLAFKTIDNLKVRNMPTGMEAIGSQATVVRNSPRVLMRDYYNEEIINSDGILDVAGREVVVLTDGNIDTTTIDESGEEVVTTNNNILGFENYDISTFRVVNTSTVQFTIYHLLTGVTTLPVGSMIEITPFNSINFNYDRVRFIGNVVAV